MKEAVNTKLSFADNLWLNNQGQCPDCKEIFHMDDLVYDHIHDDGPCKGCMKIREEIDILSCIMESIEYEVDQYVHTGTDASVIYRNVINHHGYGATEDQILAEVDIFFNF